MLFCLLLSKHIVFAAKEKRPVFLINTNQIFICADLNDFWHYEKDVLCNLKLFQTHGHNNSISAPQLCLMQLQPSSPGPETLPLMYL